MDIDAFLNEVSDTDLRLPAVAPTAVGSPEKMDALFHLPLLALAIMVIARQTPFRTTLLGRKIAMLLVEHFVALANSPQGVETSLTLRRRCADALAFLEAVRLVSVSSDNQRVVTLTEIGRRELDKAMQEESDLGLLVRQFRVKQDRVKARVGDER